MLFQAKSNVYSATFLQLVEQASKKFVCIVDESKLVEGLGGSKGQSASVHAFAYLADAVVFGCPCSHGLPANSELLFTHETQFALQMRCPSRLYNSATSTT